MPKHPVYDEESGLRFESANAAERGLAIRRIDPRLERIEGMRIIRRRKEAQPARNSEYRARRLRALYPLAYPGREP